MNVRMQELSVLQEEVVRVRRQAEEDRRKRADAELAAEKEASRSREAIRELESRLSAVQVEDGNEEVLLCCMLSYLRSTCVCVCTCACVRRLLGIDAEIRSDLCYLIQWGTLSRGRSRYATSNTSEWQMREVIYYDEGTLQYII